MFSNNELEKWTKDVAEKAYRDIKYIEEIDNSREIKNAVHTEEIFNSTKIKINIIQIKSPKSPDKYAKRYATDT